MAGPERLNMAENTPGTTEVTSSTTLSATPPEKLPIYRAANFDPSRKDYQAKTIGKDVIFIDPITGAEVARIPKIEGGAGEPQWLLDAQVESRPSTFEVALDRRDKLANFDRSKLVDLATGTDHTVAFNHLKNLNTQEIDRLMTEVQKNSVLFHLFRDVQILYREITTEPTSRYGEESRRSITDQIKIIRETLNNYQEIFWEYGNLPAFNALRQDYQGVASYMAPKIAIALEKYLKGIPLSTTEMGDAMFTEHIKKVIDADVLKKKQQGLETKAFWDRHWGSVVLTGTTQEEVEKGVANFLKVATSDESNFDPQRYIEDGSRLNQEIQRVGKTVGMKQTEIVELVAKAEGTLFINVARYFAVRWQVGEWHQIASLIGRHIDTRLNAVAKAHKAEVMHAADILDTDEEYDRYSRPARFASDLSSSNDEAAASERAKMQCRLEARIALSQLKDIDIVIREHFAGIEGPIDSFGFDRNASISATDLFKNLNYLKAIKDIDEKLRQLNSGVAGAAQLTPEERKLLALDRIRPYQKTEDLVLIDQTDEQFSNLYTEYGDFGTKVQYDAEVQRLQQKITNNEPLSKNESYFWQRDLLLKKVESGDEFTEEENQRYPEIIRKINEEVKPAVDLAIKTRDMFFISAEKACASLKTRHNIAGKGEGELLSYNDVVRFNKFVREKAIVSLPGNIAKTITASTRSGAGLMYVDIADKLEFRNIAQRVINEKSAKSPEGQNAQQALRLITLTAEEKQYEAYVQAVEGIQEKVLEKLKEKGSDIDINDIDGIITHVFQQSRISINANRDRQTVHRGETQVRRSVSYHDIVSREDADPQYNFSMIDDQKYSSLLLSDENRAAAYNPGHPYYYSIPATTRRVLDPDNTKLIRKTDPDLERADAFRAMEMQRRFHFAVDSVKVFGAFYRPDLYEDKEEVAEIVENIRNSPFIGRRMIEQRVWTLWNRGQAYRGRGFLKYLESNFRGLDHSVGRRGLRGVIASYKGYNNPKGFGYQVNFSGALDELKAEFWLGQAKAADAIRPILVGGQVGQDPNFEGLFKKILKTIGKLNYDYKAQEKGLESDLPPLIRIRNKSWEQLRGGDYEKVIDDIEDRWGRVVIYGQSLGFVGNVTHVPLAAKFSGDTAIRRMVYWVVAHPEAVDVYNINIDIARTILEPLPNYIDTGSGKVSYFGPNATLLSELLRRVILNK